jgi:phosphatidylserine/phosphatidylglycerophosphate/cardiolipin synthase-like enzyme
VIEQLTKTSKRYGKIPVYDAWVDKGGDGYGEYYNHHKAFIVNGNWFGNPRAKVTYTGSANFSAPATEANNDIVLRVLGAATYNAYSRQFTFIRKHYTHRIHKATANNVIVASHGTLVAEKLSVNSNKKVDTEAEFDDVMDR